MTWSIKVNLSSQIYIYYSASHLTLVLSLELSLRILYNFDQNLTTIMELKCHRVKISLTFVFVQYYVHNVMHVYMGYVHKES